MLVLIHTAAADVLLLKRVSPADFWQSVTGSLEHAETAAAAAVRELFEETGISKTALIDCRHSVSFEISAAWRHKYTPGTTHNKEHVFRCELPVRQPVRLAADEHSEYQWLPLAQALNKVASHTNRAALQRFVPLP